MKLFKLNSRYGMVNLISDLILTEINKVKNYNTIVQVTDCKNFFVINGQTDSSEILNLDLIKGILTSNFSHICDWSNKLNFIDLIEYDKKTEKPSQLVIGNLYYSERPIYSQEQINHFRNFSGFLYSEQNIELHIHKEKSLQNTLSVTSSFPHGYSYSMGRDLLHYSEYIMYNIGGISNFDVCMFDYDLSGLELDFKLSGTGYLNTSVIDSVIRDYFDFDLSRFEHNDYLQDILNPIDKKPWLIRDVKSEIVIF